MSQSGRIAVVHNGIIENYGELKSFLEAKGVVFTSETDTEVVAQLLEFYYAGDLLDAVFKVLHRIEGAYALGIVCADEPDKLIAVRKDSPLILGYGEGFQMLASDVTAVIQYTREVCYLDDGDVAVLTPGGVQVYDSLGQPEEKERSHVDWEISAAEKGGYEHFMFKEIMEEPKALKDTISPRIRDGKVVLDDLTITREDLEGMDRFYIIACGSSYHVGMAAKYILERLLRIPVEVTLASEFRYCGPSCRSVPWPWSSASRGRPSTPWPPCGRPSRWGPGCCPSSTWWAPPSPGSRTTCCTPGPGRRSPWPPPKPTPPSWR